MPEHADTPKPKAAKTFDRWAVRATNNTTGEQWSIHDTKAVCESELERVLDGWGKKATDTGITVEWAELHPDD